MIDITDFGEHRGRKVQRYTIENQNGTRLSVLNFAGIIQDFSVMDDGERIPLVLSSDNIEDLTRDYAINRLIGRTAGRIGGAQWQQNGQLVQTPANENGHSLHGGPAGFGEQFFDVAVDEAQQTITLSRLQRALEDGFPGDLKMVARYQLTADDRVVIELTGEQLEADGVFNPTVHTYFNLADKQTTDILQHDLQLNSQQHLVLDSDKIPTGHVANNEGTPFDLAQVPLPEALQTLKATTPEGGFDDVFIVKPSLQEAVAVLRDQPSGRQIAVYSDRNAAVVFTANQLDQDTLQNLNRGDGHPWLAVAIEAQNLPNSPNIPSFGDITIAAGQQRTHTIIYAYGKTAR
jgi:aldose 1-epimerase